MRRKKLNVALLLAGAMCLGGMTGCGNASGTEGQSSEGQQESGSGSGEKQEAGGADQIVNLKWVAVGNGMPDNYDAWKANLDAYLEEKIGVHLDMEISDWGDWGNRRSVILNSNEDYDIMFTDHGGYATNVMMNAFADITDIVQTASPDLYAMIPEEYWKAVSIQGHIYAVPTYKDSSATQYFIWDKEIAEKYEIDYENMHDLQSLTEALTTIMEGEGTVPFVLDQRGATAILQKYDAMGLGLPAIGVAYGDDSRQVVSVFEQDNIMADLKTLREWYQAGIINSDANTLAQAPSYKIFSVGQGWSQAAETTWGPNMGVEAVAVQWGDTVLSNNTVGGSLSCISSSSKNPEKALQLLELVNTDSYVRDALYYGLEGDNFVYTEDGRVHKNNNDWPMAGYTQGSFFTVTQTDDTEVNQWDEVRALNEAAIPSPVLGIFIDTTEFGDELLNCIAIYERYKNDLMTGAADPETSVAAMMDEMRSAGFETIVEKVQAQINAAF